MKVSLLGLFSLFSFWSFFLEGGFCARIVKCPLSFPSGVIEVAGGHFKDQESVFRWNFCHEFGDEDCGGSFICQTTLDGTLRSCGSVFEQFSETNEYLALQITEGTKCGHIPRSTEVRFYCAMKQNPFISEVDTCQYQLSLFHPDYCTEDETKERLLTNERVRHRPKASVLVSQTQKQLDLENEEQQKRCQFYESNLERLGEIRKKIGNFTYVVSLCDPIMNISGCRGSLACEVPTTGKGRSLGIPPLFSRGSHNARVTTPANCDGKKATLTTEIEFTKGCPLRKGTTILKLRQTSSCEYKMVLGRKNCISETKERCVELVRAIGSSECVYGESFGCSRSGMWIEKSCRGKFLCRGKEIICFTTSSARSLCKC
mmetsp:Transcript_22221/g.30571  ORF Transcript_22221/g.30571 Transcript_22221/m.30571 type:complete len:373 (+) Transcript_22221:60-1178(+)